MSNEPVPTIERQLMLAFAPLDKRAFGIAFGAAFALLVASATALSLLLDPTQRFPLHLLGEYFGGYRVSLAGILVGGAWAFGTGFCWGWFLAFARNLMLAIWLLVVRIRADLSTKRDFLDHI